VSRAEPYHAREMDELKNQQREGDSCAPDH
jgi:hypothetical protein